MSKEATLQSLRWYICNSLYLPIRQLQIHLEVGEFEYKLLKKYTKSLEDNRIENGMRLYFQVQLPDGTYVDPPPKPDHYVSQSSQSVCIYLSLTHSLTHTHSLTRKYWCSLTIVISLLHFSSIAQLHMLLHKLESLGSII